MTMAVRNTHLASPRSQAGNAAPKIIAAVVVLALVGAGVWFFFLRGPGSAVTPTLSTQTVTPGTASPDATAPAAAPAPAIDTLTVDQLFKEARTALNEQRMVSPVGNNALEFYLKILDKEPTNAGARDALRELFSTFASSAESAINARNFDESKRIMDLLTKADPQNYTLTILRSKFDAQQKLADREQAQAAAKADADAKRATEQKDAAAAAAASAAAGNPTAGSATPAAGGTSAAATGGKPATGATPTSTAAAPTPAPVAATPAPAPVGATRDAQQVRITQPAYPQAAVRKRDEGWVEVEFSVMPDGSIANAHVVDSQPVRIFDRAAVEAVQRWVFNAAMKDGQPVQSTLRRRIEFKMGGG
jgi:protein TonB